MKKRIISLVLVLCIVAAVLPIPASAYVGNIPGVDYSEGFAVPCGENTKPEKGC